MQYHEVLQRAIIDQNHSAPEIFFWGMADCCLSQKYPKAYQLDTGLSARSSAAAQRNRWVVGVRVKRGEERSTL